MGTIQGMIEALDNDVLIRQASFKDHRVWPVIRMQVYQHIIYAENGLVEARSGSRISKLQLLKGLVISAKRIPRKLKKNKTLFFTTALSLIKNHEGKYYNRICDYYVPFFDENKVSVIEEASDYLHPMPRMHAYQLFSKTLITLFSEIWVRTTIRLRKTKKIEVQNIVDGLLERINQLLKEQNKQISPDFVSMLRKPLTKHVLRIPPALYFYSNLFKNSSIGAVILEDGHYGSEKALINYCAHRAGVKVYEPQHGFLNQHHPAYYYGRQFRVDEELKKYYPDFLLTYGSYWSKVVCIPNQIVEVGNPHLEKRAGMFKNTGKKKKILVVGSSISVKETNIVLKKLAETANGYRVYFRPHPEEKNNHLERYQESYQRGILIDTEDLYQSLAESEIVIAELSTVLFEAAAFCTQVYLLNTSYTKAYFNDNIFGFRLVDIDQIQIIFEGAQVDNKSIMEYYWTDGWEKKVAEFLRIESVL